jgi:hypothetical protein
MKIACSILTLALLATPALAASPKTVSNVDFTCEITGSDKSGFNIIAVNKNTTSMSCTATCTVTLASGKTQDYDSGSPYTVGTNNQRYNVFGKASLPGGPFKDASVTKASCTAKK